MEIKQHNKRSRKNKKIKKITKTRQTTNCSAFAVIYFLKVAFVIC